MKITVEVADSLLREAREYAESRGVSLRQIVEEGLRAATRNRPERRRFHLRDGSFPGRGLSGSLSWGDVRKRIYEGRGEA